MLVADAAKAVHDETKKEPGKHIADVRGVIGELMILPQGKTKIVIDC